MMGILSEAREYVSNIKDFIREYLNKRDQVKIDRVIEKYFEESVSGTLTV